jgi:tripartite-type tricarboxylate transporter receptor subunit TctC
MTKNIKTTVFVLFQLLMVSANAQQYPQKAIELTVPFAAGGSTDLGGRVLAQMLEARWKVPVRIINKPGGNTVPAVSDLMRADPSGYSLLVDGPPQSSMLDIVVKDLPFNSMNRTFIAVTAYTPMKFIVPYDSPFKSLRDAVASVAANPGSFTWTSLGGAGAQDMVFRQLFKVANVDVSKTRAIQLKGGSEAVTMIAGGHVMMGAGPYAAIAAPLNAKKLRVLAVAAPERWPELLDVPTTGEAGYPAIEVLYWIGVSGPPKMPPEVVRAWNEAVREIATSAEYRDRLAKIGLAPLYMDAEKMLQKVNAEAVQTKALYSQQ